MISIPPESVVTKNINLFQQLWSIGYSTIIKIVQFREKNYTFDFIKSWRQKCWYYGVERQVLDDGEKYNSNDHLAPLSLDLYYNFEGKTIFPNFKIVAVSNEGNDLRVVGFCTKINGKFEEELPFDFVTLYADDGSNETITVPLSGLTFRLVSIR